MLKVNNKDIRTTSLTIIYSRDNLYNKKKTISNRWKEYRGIFRTLSDIQDRTFSWKIDNSYQPLITVAKSSVIGAQNGKHTVISSLILGCVYMKLGRFSSRSRLKEMRSRQMRDKNLHINASSRDDFENKSFQSYHVIKRSQ